MVVLQPWHQFIRRSADYLQHIDIAVLNFAAAWGLPGVDAIGVEGHLRTLDECAERIRWDTQKHMHLFERNPEQYERSRNYFRILSLITVLQRDLGYRYNPVKIPEDAPFEPADSFLHGLLETVLV
jgi:hypothetical protein